MIEYVRHVKKEMYIMAQQHTYDTKKKLETAVLVGVHAQSDKSI